MSADERLRLDGFGRIAAVGSVRLGKGGNMFVRPPPPPVLTRGPCDHQTWALGAIEILVVVGGAGLIINALLLEGATRMVASAFGIRGHG